MQIKLTKKALTDETFVSVSKTSHVSVQDYLFNPGCTLKSSSSEMFEKFPRKAFVVKSFSSKVAGL